MLLALVFRGVAFEFRFRDSEHRSFWDHGFAYGSLLATFAQGVMLGAFIQGFEVDGRHFAGGSLDCFTPFSLLTGVAPGVRLRPAGRRLAGPEDRRRSAGMARRARPLRASSACCVAVVAVSLWTPLIEPRHRRALVLLAEHRLLAPVPVLTALRGLGRVARAATTGSEAAPFARGFGAVRAVLRRHRDQPVPDDRAVPVHALAGRLVRVDPGLPAGRHAAAAAGVLIYTAWSYWVFRGKVRADIGYH